MCNFLISCKRQVQHCRYYSIPLCDQINAVLKHIGFSRSRCVQIENTGSKPEETTRISQFKDLSIVNWAIIKCTFLVFAHTFSHGTQTRRILLRIFLAAYLEDGSTIDMCFKLPKGIIKFCFPNNQQNFIMPLGNLKHISIILSSSKSLNSL